LEEIMDPYQLLTAFRTMDELIETKREPRARAMRVSATAPGAARRGVGLPLVFIVVLLLAVIAATVVPAAGSGS
jgi:hypothetical protein